MISNIQKLKKHNPFLEWDSLSHELQHTAKPKELVYRKYLTKVNWKLFEFGDSIFIPMVRKYWKKSHKMYRYMDLLKFHQLKIIWYRQDPVCGLEGIRVWCFHRKMKIKRPRMSFRIYYKEGITKHKTIN